MQTARLYHREAAGLCYVLTDDEAAAEYEMATSETKERTDSERFLAKQLFIMSGCFAEVLQEFMGLEQAARTEEAGRITERIHALMVGDELRQRLYKFFRDADVYPEAE